MKLHLLVISIFICLTACTDSGIPPPVIKTVASIGSCTAGTGGWGGSSAECRVTFTDGTRGTAVAPVDVGDTCQLELGRWYTR